MLHFIQDKKNRRFGGFLILCLGNILVKFLVIISGGYIRTRNLVAFVIQHRQVRHDRF